MDNQTLPSTLPPSRPTSDPIHPEIPREPEDPARVPVEEPGGGTDQEIGDRIGPGAGYDQEPEKEKDKGGVV